MNSIYDELKFYHNPTRSELPLLSNHIKKPAKYRIGFTTLLCIFVLLGTAVSVCSSNNSHNAYKCLPSKSSVSCNLRTGNLLIGRESQIKASSTCGLNGPQRYCSKDRRCYTCDSRAGLNGKPLNEYLDHSIGNVIKRRRLDRQHNVTYARDLLNLLIQTTSEISPDNWQQQQAAQAKNNMSELALIKWWQAENGVENVTIQIDFENEFLFTHMIMHFNSFYPAIASVERSLDFGTTWQVYQYYATNCHLSYPNVDEGPKSRVNQTICEDLPSLEPSDDGELVMKILAPTPSYVADRERTLVEALYNISTFSEPLLNEYQELKQIMRVTNLRINLIRLQTLGDEYYAKQFHDEIYYQDERVKEIYHFGLNDLFVYGSCSCNGHSSRCIKKPSKLTHETADGDIVDTNNEDNDEEDMIYGYCECEHNTQGANCHLCLDLFNDWPWRPAGPNQGSECRKCECNNHADKCKFDLELFHRTNYSSGGICINCSHNTRGRRCHLCELGYYQSPEKTIDQSDACQTCQCNKDGVFNMIDYCYQGDRTNELYDQEDNLAYIKFTDELRSEMNLYQNNSNGSIPLGQCLCKAHVGGLKCDQCRSGYFGFKTDSKNVCQKCTCNTNGTIKDIICNPQSGQCQCKKDVSGDNCDTCSKGYYGLDQFGECRPCQCDQSGSESVSECHPISGQCMCKDNTYGRKCDQCGDGFWSYPDCKPCTCNGQAKTCDQLSGECINCSNFTTGPYCDECISGFYGQPVMPINLNSSQSSYKKSLISINITSESLIYIPCSACSCPGFGPESSEYYANWCHMSFPSNLDDENNKVLHNEQPFQCVCKSGFAGLKCESCAQNYWGHNGNLGKNCQLCQCNNNWNISSIGNCDVDTGKCHQCLNNTEGDHCELCKPGYYGDATNQSCNTCDCDKKGVRAIKGHSEVLEVPCNRQTGRCKCADHVEGDRCDKCQAHYWNLTYGSGCESCWCDVEGTIATKNPTTQTTLVKPCEPMTGQCECKTGYGGRMCNECGDGFWGDPKSIKKCRACNCNRIGSKSNDCEKSTGQCECLSGMTGKMCELCAPGYYFHRDIPAVNLSANTTNEHDLLVESLSPKSCLACGECYNQWHSQLNQLFLEANTLELESRKSLNYNQQLLSHHQTNVRVGHSPSNFKETIERKIQMIIGVILEEKLIKDKFITQIRIYNETKGNLESELQSSTDVADLGREVNVLMRRMEILDLFRNHLNTAIDQFNYERVAFEKTLLKDHQYNSWADNFKQASISFDNSLSTYDTVINVKQQTTYLITNTTESYRTAIDNISKEAALSRRISYLFSMDLPLMNRTNQSISLFKKSRFHDNVKAQVDYDSSPAARLFNYDDWTSVRPPPVDVFLDIYHLNSNWHKNPYKLHFIEDDEVSCNLQNWRQCSMDLKLFERRLNQMIESTLDLIQNHTKTLDSSSDDLNHLTELHNMSSFFATQESAIRDQVTKLDKYINSSLANTSNQMATSPAVTDTNIAPSLIGDMDRTSNLEHQANVLDNLTDVLNGTIQSFKIGQASDLSTWIKANGFRHTIPSNTSWLSLISTWKLLDKEIREDLRPRWLRVTDFIKNDYMRPFREYKQELNLYSIPVESGPEFKVIMNEINLNIKAGETVLDDLTRPLLNGKNMESFDARFAKLDDQYETILRSEAQNVLTINLCENFISEANKTIKELDDQQVEDSHNSITAVKLSRDLLAITWKLNRASHLLMDEPAEVVRPASRQLKQLVGIYAKQTANRAEQWSNLRRNFAKLQTQLEWDYKTLNEYDSMSVKMQSRGDKLEQTLEKLQLEASSLEENIKTKWLHYEKCQG